MDSEPHSLDAQAEIDESHAEEIGLVMVQEFGEGSELPVGNSHETIGVAAVRGLVHRRKADRVNPNSDSFGYTDESLAVYLKKIGSHPLLTKDQEVELGHRIHAGLAAAVTLESDPELSEADPTITDALLQVEKSGLIAQETFTLSNLRLVVSVAKQYTNRGIALMDLIQEGNLGLMHAVIKYNPDKGFKFSTYAVWWIRQSIERNCLETDRGIRVPKRLSEAVNATRDQNQDPRSLGIIPVVAGQVLKTSKRTGSIDPNTIEAAKKVLDNGVLSLNDVIGNGDSELGDFIASSDNHGGPDEIAVSIDRTNRLDNQINELLSCLSERERYVMSRRYGLTRGGDACERMKLQEIGDELGLSKERIRQIENKAVRKLKAHVKLTGQQFIE